MMPEIMVNTENGEEYVNIEFYCSKCGQGICRLCDPGKTRCRSQPYFTVTPCECQSKQIDELEDKVERLLAEKNKVI